MATPTTTNFKMMQLEATSADRAVRFAINYARNQYGNRVGRQIAGLVLAGHSVAVAQGDGFFVNGHYVAVGRADLGRRPFLPESDLLCAMEAKAEWAAL